mgnify:CR=1 FL=1
MPNDAKCHARAVMRVNCALRRFFAISIDFRRLYLVRPPHSKLLLHDYIFICNVHNINAMCITLMQAMDVSESEQKRYTSIRVSKETVELLKERGRKGESYDDIIRKLLEKRRR